MLYQAAAAVDDKLRAYVHIFSLYYRVPIESLIQHLLSLPLSRPLGIAITNLRFITVFDEMKDLTLSAPRSRTTARETQAQRIFRIRFREISEPRISMSEDTGEIVIFPLIQLPRRKSHSSTLCLDVYTVFNAFYCCIGSGSSKSRDCASSAIDLFRLPTFWLQFPLGAWQLSKPPPEEEMEYVYQEIDPENRQPLVSIKGNLSVPLLPFIAKLQEPFRVICNNAIDLVLDTPGHASDLIDRPNVERAPGSSDVSSKARPGRAEECFLKHVEGDIWNGQELAGI